MEEVPSYVSQIILPEFTLTIQTLYLIKKILVFSQLTMNRLKHLQQQTARNPWYGFRQNIGLIVNLNQPDSCEGTTFVCLNVCLLFRSFVCPLTFYIFAFFQCNWVN